MTKRCPKCNTEKEVCEFGKNKAKPDGLQSVCKTCKKQYNRKDYEKNITDYKRRTKESKEKAKAWFITLKSGLSCAQCGESHIAVLDFHHTNPSEKEDGVSVFVNSGSIEKAKKELEKCIVLCSNCHRKLHYELAK